MSNTKKEYFEKQIKGLIFILEDNQGVMIARSYVKEKLKMILSGGISFHPSIKKQLDTEKNDNKN